MRKLVNSFKDIYKYIPTKESLLWVLFTSIVWSVLFGVKSGVLFTLVMLTVVPIIGYLALKFIDYFFFNFDK